MYEIFQEVYSHLRSMWRFRWYAMGLAWIIVIVGWMGVYLIPDKYTVTSRVHVDTESVLRPLLRGLAIEPNISQRLRIMSRTLLSRPNIAKLARMTDLDIKAGNQKDLDKIIDRLASNIRLKSDRRNNNLYQLTYTGPDPKVAKNVVQNLLTIFVESSLGQSRENTDTAQKFINQQINEYESRMNATIIKLEEFKKANAGLMPTLRNGYFQTMQKLDQDIETLKMQVKEAQTRRDELRRQVAGEEPVFGIMPQNNNAITTQYDARIEALEKQLSDLLLQYTDVHPQVISIRDTLNQLKEKRKQEIAAMPVQQRNQPILDKNPVYQQLKISLNQADTDLSVLKARVKEYASRKSELGKKMGELPRFEAELNQLNQEYGSNRKKYEELIKRRDTATLSEQAEQAGDSVKIKIIDPPRVPYKPSGPKRSLLNAAVLFAGLGIGLAFTFLLAQLKPVVFDIKKLREITGLPVLGGVSQVWSEELRKKKIIEYGGFIAALSLLFASYGVTVVL